MRETTLADCPRTSLESAVYDTSNDVRSSHLLVRRYISQAAVQAAPVSSQMHSQQSTVTTPRTNAPACQHFQQALHCFHSSCSHRHFAAHIPSTASTQQGNHRQCARYPRCARTLTTTQTSHSTPARSLEELAILPQYHRHHTAASLTPAAAEPAQVLTAACVQAAPQPPASAAPPRAAAAGRRRSHACCRPRCCSGCCCGRCSSWRMQPGTLLQKLPRSTCRSRSCWLAHCCCRSR